MFIGRVIPAVFLSAAAVGGAWAQEPAAFGEPPSFSTAAPPAPARISTTPAPGETWRIGTVTIVVKDVFDPAAPSESKSFHKVVNRLHPDTREFVVERELLFGEGDPYDPALLRESERILRRFGFLRRVKVEAAAPKDGVVDVTVTTWDNWTFEPTASYKRAGDKNSWRAGLQDGNVLGLGKSMNATYGQGFSAVERRYSYGDPQFLGQRLEAEAVVIHDEEARAFKFSIAKPFYASIAKTFLALAGSYRDERVLGENAIKPDGKMRRITRDGSLSWGVSLGSSPRLVRRVKTAVSHSRTRLESIPGESMIPAGQEASRSTSLDVIFNREHLDFIKEQNIRKLGRDEDYNMGWTLALGLGGRPKFLGSSSGSYSPSFRLTKGHSFGPGHFGLLESAYSSSYVGLDAKSLSWRLGGEYYRTAPWRQTLALHAAFDHGYRLKPPDSFRLGEEEGLRGYGLKQFSGNRRILVNVEDRILFFPEAFKLVAIGGVVFLDSGAAWRETEDLSFTQVRTSIGAGLRLASTRGGAGNPVRIDVAYAFNTGRSVPLSVSILTGQAF